MNKYCRDEIIEISTKKDSKPWIYYNFPTTFSSWFFSQKILHKILDNYKTRNVSIHKLYQQMAFQYIDKIDDLTLIWINKFKKF